MRKKGKIDQFWKELGSPRCPAPAWVTWWRRWSTRPLIPEVWQWLLGKPQTPIRALKRKPIKVGLISLRRGAPIWLFSAGDSHVRRTRITMLTRWALYRRLCLVKRAGGNMIHPIRISWRHIRRCQGSGKGVGGAWLIILYSGGFGKEFKGEACNVLPKKRNPIIKGIICN